METFTGLKDLIHNPHYGEQRQRHLAKLDMGAIDAPIVDLVSGFAALSCCFTLQSCYGHFLYSGQGAAHNVGPLPVSDRIAHVEYRIAYIALCIEDSDPGRNLFHALEQIPAIDPQYIQFGCAEWFWNRQVNSYALQVEPERYKTKDRVRIPYQEALHVEKTRDRFFAQLEDVLCERLGRDKSRRK